MMKTIVKIWALIAITSVANAAEGERSEYHGPAHEITRIFKKIQTIEISMKELKSKLEDLPKSEGLQKAREELKSLGIKTSMDELRSLGIKPSMDELKSSEIETPTEELKPELEVLPNRQSWGKVCEELKSLGKAEAKFRQRNFLVPVFNSEADSYTVRIFDHCYKCENEDDYAVAVVLATLINPSTGWETWDKLSHKMWAGLHAKVKVYRESYRDALQELLLDVIEYSLKPHS